MWLNIRGGELVKTMGIKLCADVNDLCVQRTSLINGD